MYFKLKWLFISQSNHTFKCCNLIKSTSCIIEQQLTAVGRVTHMSKLPKCSTAHYCILNYSLEGKHSQFLIMAIHQLTILWRVNTANNGHTSIDHSLEGKTQLVANNVHTFIDHSLEGKHSQLLIMAIHPLTILWRVNTANNGHTSNDHPLEGKHSQLLIMVVHPMTILCWVNTNNACACLSGQLFKTVQFTLHGGRG